MNKKHPAEFTALYRKYRPQSFKEVVGQDHIIEALQSAISLGRIAHAYIFHGSRGTGKTSVARIFAKSIGTSEKDIYEIDAASNTGVDNIRELREGVSTYPFESEYKVYIIDEVHMLSKSAFNALLKTLEEPPAHAIFILATTEMEKIPETVVSRCQVFNFKKPNQKTLATLATEIAKKEGFSLDTAGAELLGLLGDGSFRDMQGNLQKVISASGDKKITTDLIESITGAPKGEIVNAVVRAIVSSDKEAGLKAISEAVSSQVDMKVFAKLILQKMRILLLLKSAPAIAKKFLEEISSDEAVEFEKMVKENSAGINSQVLLKLLEVYDLIGHSSVPELPLELAVIELTGGTDPSTTLRASN